MMQLNCWISLKGDYLIIMRYMFSFRYGNGNSRIDQIEAGSTFKVKYSKICLKQPLKRRPKTGFEDQLSLNVGQT